MLSDQKNSKKQGDVGLGRAISHFTDLGISVSVPLTDSQDYDLVVDLEDGLKKVQVKTSRYKRYNNYIVTLRMAGGNRKKNYVAKLANELVYDLLFVVDGDNNHYLIPKSAVEHVTGTICLGSKYQEYRC